MNLFLIAGSHVAVTLFTEFVPANKRALFVILLAGFWAVGAILEAAIAWIIMPSVPKSVYVGGLVFMIIDS